MSLLKAHWLVLAAGAAVAVAAPLRLLRSDAPPPAAPPAASPIEVAVDRPATLAFAQTAPPFTAGRLPQPEAEPPETAEASAEPAPAPSPPPALVGLAVQNRGRAVALARGASGETLMLARGEAIDGWTLVAVGRDQATFEREGARHTARLDFGNRPGAQAGAVPARAPAPASFVPTPTVPARNAPGPSIQQE